MSNTESLWNTIEKLQQEVKVLRAELESGQSTWLDVLEANENLKAENERLRVAGDAMYDFAVQDSMGIWVMPPFDKWSKEFHSKNKDKGVQS
jgi:regulator of replication initiation timing